MSLRGWIKRLERSSKGELVTFPQEDGSIARFHQDDLAEAFLVNQWRIRGEYVPPHPLTAAAANSSEEVWRKSFFAEATILADEEIEDLSEP